MGFTTGILVFVGKIAFMIFGFRWCKDVFGRLGSDLATLKESGDKADKGLVVFWWVVTLGIILLIVYIGWGLLGRPF